MQHLALCGLQAGAFAAKLYKRHMHTVAPPGNLITNALHAVCTWRLEDRLVTTHFPVGA